MKTIGLVGLGIIGTAFTRNLIEDGFSVVGYDIDPDRVEILKTAGGLAAASAADAADRSDLVITAVASPGALPAIAGGRQGLTESGRDGLVVVDVSTLPLDEKEQTRVLLADHGITLVDCTISGTGREAEARELVFMAGGPPDAVAAARSVLSKLGRAFFDLGAFGNGTKMKFIANLLVGIHTVSTAEALLLAERSGFDLDQTLEVIGSGVGNSRMWEIRGPMIVGRTYRQAAAKVSMWVKDTHLIAAFARDLEVPTPLLDQACELYEAAESAGMAEWDAAAVYEVLEGMSPGRER